MSALGQKRTFAVQKRHVRFTPKSGHVRRTRHVRFVPIADISVLVVLCAHSSKLGPVSAGNFIQLFLRSLYGWYAGSGSYFSKKTFQPRRCDSPE